MSDWNELDRRDFLRVGLAGGMFALTPLTRMQAGQSARRVALVVDPADRVASAPPARWALGELGRALTDAGADVHWYPALGHGDAGDRCLVACGSGSDVAKAATSRANVSVGDGAERLALLTTRVEGRDALVACGSDARGLTYALLELGDRLRADRSLESSLAVKTPIVERPANPVRSVMRQFTSEPLDRGWFNDRKMWPRYLAMLATHRFNRLHLAFGLGYDFLQNVADSYFLFLYPFLVSVPGYDVRVTNLSDAERDRNLDTLKFISEQTVAHGLDFQLGVWMHGYELNNSPKAQHIVQGLTAEKHAAYSRDALTAVLRACPAISAVALRIHGESGVAEGSYDFWQTVFEGVKNAGRTIEIDLHAKGIDQTMIDRALATGMPVNVSPKYWAEHLGMPYHQAAIRELEMPVEGKSGRGLMTLSEGSRSFTRYGYADLLRDGRRFTVRHRIFAGTQRILASGDPRSSAAYSRMFQFCGSSGVDVMEPLTCRGRRGTGIAGTRRSGYADATLDTRWDWEKFSYWYRVFGRTSYNPDTDPLVFQRDYGTTRDAESLRSALAHASRILPIVTTAHLPSAACDAYWPEVYWNQPMVAEPRPNPYGDTPAPKTFQHVSPADPQLFSTVAEHADELLKGESSGKYSPLEVASWLEELAAHVVADLAVVDPVPSPEWRRLSIDLHIQANLGEFFAAKFRSGVLYAIHERTNDRHALEEAVKEYRRARQAWATLCDRARTVYAADLSASDKFSERGQWSDRLAGIDDDIERMAQRASSATALNDGAVTAALGRIRSGQKRVPAPGAHTPPSGLNFNKAVPLSLTVASGHTVSSARCYYRHVNQAKRFEVIDMQPISLGYQCAIPALYVESRYPLQYYFTLKEGATTHLYPGLGPELMSQPYFVLRRITF